MKDITIQQVAIGDRESWTRTITEADVVFYAGIIGDRGPMHLDEEFAKTTRFGGRVSYGMLNAGYIGAVLAQLLGIRSAYVAQTLAFLAPVMIGDTVKIEAVVIRKDEQRSRAWVRTTCTPSKRNARDRRRGGAVLFLRRWISRTPRSDGLGSRSSPVVF